MVDTIIPDLPVMLGADLHDDDVLAVDNISASDTEQLAISELLISLQLRGSVKFLVGEPPDVTLNAGECYIWLDNTVSPQTLNIKVKDTSSPEAVFKSVL